MSGIFAGLAVVPGDERQAFRVLAGGGDLPDSADLLTALLGRPEWMDHAACRGMPTELFFPARGESTKEAKAICADCPVREQCLEFALGRGADLQGIWAGTATKARRKLSQPPRTTTVNPPSAAPLSTQRDQPARRVALRLGAHLVHIATKTNGKRRTMTNT